MKRYVLFCCIGLSVSASRSFAQLWVGLEGGYTKNYLYTNAGYRAFTKYDPASGFSLGLPIQYSVSSWLAIQADPQFIQKNYQLTRTGFYQGIYQATTNQYWQLPVMGHFSFGGPSLKGFLNLGAYASYWAASANRGVTPNIDNASDDAVEHNSLLDKLPAQYFNESYAFDSRKDRRSEFGWLAGVGLSYQKEKYKFFVEARHDQALSDQQKAYMINQIPRYNQTYLVQIGWLYQLTLK